MTTRVPSRDLIMAALAQATTPLTVTELAEQAGVGRSTVSKYLPLLEKEGAVLRTPGGREGRRRLPDHWQAAPPTSTEQDPPTHEATSATADLTDTAPSTTVEATEPEQVDPAPASTGTGATAPQAPVELAHEVECSDTDQMPAPDSKADLTQAAPVPTPSTPEPDTNTTPAQNGPQLGMGEEGINPVSGSRRLAPGELKLMVWALLKADPEQEFTATALSHLLQGRSIGAIQNNLAKLAKEGKAELTCDKPRRYRFTTSAH